MNIDAVRTLSVLFTANLLIVLAVIAVLTRRPRTWR